MEHGDSDLLAQCRLDLEGLRAQRDRYRRLGGWAEEIERGPTNLTVHFGADLDAGLLEETIAIERTCCPFFEFDFSPATRRLRIGVQRDDQARALEALLFALGG